MSKHLKGRAAGGTAAALLGLGIAAALAAGATYPSTGTPAAAKASATAKSLKVTATLTPAQEVPKPKATKGSGSFTGTLSSGGKLTYTLTFTGLSGAANASHLHKGKPGTSGPVVVPLCPPGCKSPLKGTKTITKSFVAAMKGGDAYVNVHTAKNPGGEIRGLIKVG